MLDDRIKEVELDRKSKTIESDGKKEVIVYTLTFEVNRKFEPPRKVFKEWIESRSMRTRDYLPPDVNMSREYDIRGKVKWEVYGSRKPEEGVITTRSVNRKYVLPGETELKGSIIQYAGDNIAPDYPKDMTKTQISHLLEEVPDKITKLYAELGINENHGEKVIEDFLSKPQ